ncbi:hypothetical protein KFK09_012453 [Dendrobium nobile]|uniref:Uncharacterized protein n=1 Tax=Dendrobium nobile TaxID=94219 RepID=A0A8T3BIZ4_DENNO|nr:hypothetical protein KFK09_012453 [Dendrobium nobile]
MCSDSSLNDIQCPHRISENFSANDTTNMSHQPFGGWARHPPSSTVTIAQLHDAIY